MAKKISPKDQTEEIRNAKWAFLQRGDKQKAAFFEAYPELVRLRDKPISLSMSQWDEIFKEMMCAPAVKEAFINSQWTFMEIRRKTAGKNCNYQEMNLAWKEEILKDAPAILDSLIPTDLPAETLIVGIDLTRATDVIMAEFGEILSRNKASLAKIPQSRPRPKWVSIYDDLLSVYDLWVRSPKPRCFSMIAEILRKPESTVRKQWRRAYELIHGKEFSREQRSTGRDGFCSERCKDAKKEQIAKCYRVINGNMKFTPCSEFVKLFGKNTFRDETNEKFDEMLEAYSRTAFDESEEEDDYGRQVTNQNAILRRAYTRKAYTRNMIR